MNKMLSYILQYLPITDGYSPIPNVEGLVSALGTHYNNYDHRMIVTNRHIYSQDAIDNIITYIPITAYEVIRGLLIYTQSIKVMNYISSQCTEAEIVYIISILLHSCYPNRYVVTYLNSKYYTPLSQLKELTAIYPDLYNTSVDSCIGYECADDIGGLYILQKYTPKNAYNIIKMLNRCSRKVIYNFTMLLKKDTPQLKCIRDELNMKGITLNI